MTTVFIRTPFSSGASRSASIFLMAFFQIITLSSCSQNKLVNRWMITGYYYHGELRMEKGKVREYEFLRNGQFNVYKEGGIEMNGTYTMASDSKSVLIKDENQSATLKIHKLTASELVLVFPGKDTTVLYASGSAAAKQALSKSENYHKKQKSWLALTKTSMSRMLAVTLLKDEAKGFVPEDNIHHKNLSATGSALAATEPEARKQSKEAKEKYFDLQVQYSKEIKAYIEYLKSYPTLTATENFKNYTESLLQNESNLKKEISEFVKAYNSYEGKQVLKPR